MNPDFLIPIFAQEFGPLGWTCFGFGFVVAVFLLFAQFKGIKWLLGSIITPPNPNQIREDEMKLALGNSKNKTKIDYKVEQVPQWKVLPREKTMRLLLKFIALQDNWFERKYLCEVLEESAILIREAIEDRSVQRVEDFLTPEHADELHSQFKTMKKKGHRRIFGKAEVTDIAILHIETTGAKTDQTVTALLTVQSKDFVEDDESGKLISGTKKTYYFQEFVTLRRGKKRWLVELIRPSTDSDHVLEAKSTVTKEDYAEIKADGDADLLAMVVAK